MPRLDARRGMGLALRQGAAPPPMNSLEAHEIANDRTVMRNLDLCVPDNGGTAGGSRGRAQLGLVPRGNGASALW